MIDSAGEILLLSPGPPGGSLAERLGPQAVVRVEQPYQALEHMGRRRWAAVVLQAGPRGLSRPVPGQSAPPGRQRPAGPVPPAAGAARQAAAGGRAGRLLHLPADPGGPGGDPPCRPGGCRPAWEQASVQAGLSPRQYAGLVEVAVSVSSLEAHLAELVADRLGQPVRWADAHEAGADQPLLLAAGDRPRVLLGPARGPSPPAEPLLEQLRQVLPALLATAQRSESLQRLAITDHLTGLYNRRYFYLMTDQILLRASRNEASVTLLLYDIDDFKRYNDSYGYAAGDEILRETAHLMRRISRTQDLVARIGGDEFAVLFWDPAGPRTVGSKPLQTACDLADRFRRAVGEYQFPLLGPEARGALSISGGLALHPETAPT